MPTHPSPTWTSPWKNHFDKSYATLIRSTAETAASSSALESALVEIFENSTQHRQTPTISITQTGTPHPPRTPSTQRDTPILEALRQPEPTMLKEILPISRP
ncbi:uncharacterized protein MCYG_00944 [Microsporum canis CBS 113480]|uniref:Uncharacterized protein n=1 Tax=Arthroderma otae (strain ATCC MYA-4605 / CBS 113480) TaxID=554155 RepID=C5FE22_ARTOC|nr:uncharacterized protein MCYG_00944 [Microsporum canis CBS 113480]EEQ28056.1 predicted protein [Microsporum canis CBS 113480]